MTDLYITCLAIVLLAVAMGISATIVSMITEAGMNPDEEPEIDLDVVEMLRIPEWSLQVHGCDSPPDDYPFPPSYVPWWEQPTYVTFDNDLGWLHVGGSLDRTAVSHVWADADGELAVAA